MGGFFGREFAGEGHEVGRRLGLDEGVEGVGVGEGRFGVGVPLHEVVRGAIEGDAELFELGRADVTEAAVRPIGGGLGGESQFYEEFVGESDAAELHDRSEVDG